MHLASRGRRTVPLVLALLALPLLAGCAFLSDPLWYGLGPGASFDPNASFDPYEGLPTPSTTFRTGQAEIVFEGQAPIRLRVREAGIFGGMGAVAVWEDETGWYLQMMGDGMPIPTSDGPSGWWITLDRIADGRHLSADGSSCTVKTTRSDASGLAGTATCGNLAWRDAVPAIPLFRPSPGASPFPARATITFSATP